jgi:hypothetical protein
MARNQSSAARARSTAPAAKRSSRRLWRIVISVWAGTVALLAASLRIHPAATANIQLSAAQVTFRLRSLGGLNVKTWDSIHVNRIRAISGAGVPFVAQDAAANHPKTLQSLDADYASCTFHRARLLAFRFERPGNVTVTSTANRHSFEIHASEAAAKISVPADVPVECTGVTLDGGPAAMIELRSYSSSDLTLEVRSAEDTRIELVPPDHSDPAQEQLLASVPLFDDVTVAREDIVPGPSGPVYEQHGATTGQANKIIFKGIATPVEPGPDAIVVVHPVPGRCYLSSLSAGDGLQLVIQGEISDIETGGGPRLKASCMPSLFDQLDGKARFFAAIPAFAGALILILEKSGLLKK